MTTRERMSGVDTAWLRMETPTNLMMIVGVMMFEEKLDLATVRRVIGARFLAYPRFRCRAAQDAVGAWWESDGDPDMTWHVRKHPGRGRMGKAALENLVSDLASTPLDFSRPLWQFHLVEDYEGGSAMILRIHHCIADGIALISVMLSITDGGADPPARRRREPAEENDADWLADAILRPFTDLTVKAIGLTGIGMARSVEMLAHPQQPLELARMGVQVVSIDRKSVV